MPRRRILFYTHALAPGGAERVWALLATGLARRGHQVDFAVDAAMDENAAFLDDSVRLFTLGRRHGPSVRRLAGLIGRRRPDVSLSALGVSNLKHFAATALAGRLNRAILSCHGHFGSERGRLSRLGNALTPVTSRLCARTVCVSDSLRADVVIRWLASPGRTVRIYNPVFVEAAVAPGDAAELARREPVVLAAGRLVEDKNFGFLLRAFARLDRSARLIVLGEGPERGALDAEIRRLGLSGRVEMPGYEPVPWPYFQRARVFALSSLRESFGNVVVEALAHGLPVVATDCGGPCEILEGGRFGEIVPRTEAEFAAALARALADPGDPAGRIARARKFSVDESLDRYEALIENVAEQHP